MRTARRGPPRLLLPLLLAALVTVPLAGAVYEHRVAARPYGDRLTLGPAAPETADHRPPRLAVAGRAVRAYAPGGGGIRWTYVRPGHHPLVVRAAAGHAWTLWSDGLLTDVGLPPHGAPTVGVPPHGAPADDTPAGALPPHGAPPHAVPPHGASADGLPPHTVPPHGTPRTERHQHDPQTPHETVRWHRGVPESADWLTGPAARRGAGVLQPLDPAARMLAVVTPGRITAYRTADGDLRWVLPARPGCAFAPHRFLRRAAVLLIAQPCRATGPRPAPDEAVPWTAEIVPVDAFGRIAPGRAPLGNTAGDRPATVSSALPAVPPTTPEIRLQATVRLVRMAILLGH
ncbi:hypothetical protein [Streptomyces sp. NPDC003077]|uniref:hypothetical protein n=1 Tax=Streptomyces sp. NPDC003077 TaxID=3154443 RepID=UPI0033AD3992